MGVFTAAPGVFSGKVGWSTFHSVCRAVYVLQEFYTKDFSLFLVDGSLKKATAQIGWLNYLFSEHYTNRRVYSPWHALRLLHESNGAEEYWNTQVSIYPDWLDEEHVSGVSALCLIAATSRDIFKHIVEICSEEVMSDPASHAGRCLAIRLALQGIAEDTTETTEYKISRIKEILVSARKAKEIAESSCSESYKQFARLSNMEALPLSIYFISEIFQLDFWSTYEEVRCGDDERAYIYGLSDADENLSPINAISTDEYLDVTGDDRAYWWREEGDVSFSAEMTDWLKGIKGKIDVAASGGAIYDNGVEFLHAFVDTLDAFAKAGDYIYIFRETFFEFVMDWKDVRKQAAVVVMKQLYVELCASESKTENVDWTRRYLAVLANPTLREKVLGF